MLIPFHAPIVPAVVTYVSTASSTANTGTYTFATQNIGTAAANRHVVVCVETSGNTASSSEPSSATLGGVAMSKSVSATCTPSGAGAAGAAIFILAQASGTTADIEITMPNTNQLRCGIQVYAIYGLDSATAVSTNSATSTGASALNATIDYSSGGAVIACATVKTNATCTWTNLTEDVDASVESTDMTSASKAPSSSATGETITSTFTASGQCALVIASWR